MSTELLKRQDLNLLFNVEGSSVTIKITPSALSEFYDVAGGNPLQWMSGTYWAEVVTNLCIYLSNLESHAKLMETYELREAKFRRIMESPTDAH